MAEADKVTFIPLDLSTREWQRIKITNDMPSTDYLVPNDDPSPVMIKPPDPNSNSFQSMKSLCIRWITNKPSLANLQQGVVPDFAESSQTNFRVIHLTKGSDPSSELTELERDRKIGLSLETNL